MESATTLYLLATLLAVVVLLLWVLLPFAVFGIKPLLRQVLEEQRAQTALLRALSEARAGRTDTRGPPASGNG